MAIVFAEVGDGLVIRQQATGDPHQLDIAAGLAFQASARLHPTEIAVDVQLEEDGGMVRQRPIVSGTTPSRPSALRSS